MKASSGYLATSKSPDRDSDAVLYSRKDCALHRCALSWAMRKGLSVLPDTSKSSPGSGKSSLQDDPKYLCLAMLMIGVFGCTLQLTQEKIACLPSRYTSPTPNAIDCSHIRTYGDNDTLESPVNPIIQEVKGRKNDLDIHQYVFVNAYCYTSFWFKYPGTSSKIELFVSILGKCFDSPWTTRALSEVSEERGEEKLVSLRRNTISEKHRTDDEDTVGLLLRSSSVKSNPERKPPEPQSTVTALDKKEGEQAKALFEKVKKLRTHVEEADILYVMYVLQTSLKVLKFLSVIIYATVLVHNIQIVVRCKVPPELTGFSIFCCNHNKAPLFSKLAYCYICFVGVYGLVCIYTLYWLFHRPLKEYSFEQVRFETGISDIPDVKNDFAFLLHLVDQYDSLYSKRFAVFLSEVSESRLYHLNLNYEWTAKKLRTRLAKNSSNRLELQLLMLPGLPDTVFELNEVEALKLEQVKNVTFPPSVAKLDSLQELSLIYCPAKLQLPAMNFFKERLKVLRLAFESVEELPLWMYTLHSLEELHLSGPLSNEVSRSSTLDSLRDLKSLRVLNLHCSLTKIPTSVGDVALQLQRLSVNNDGEKLQALSSLKKLTSLVSLELVSCGLERIPSAIFSLHNLQELDLKENKLTTVEEILSLQHCQRLTTLKLWHNKITYIPDHITKLHSLEVLDISWNKIRKLPSRLFYCTKLRHLDVSHNQLTSLPPEVGILQALQFFSAAFNSLENLPEELFSCKRLRILALGSNSLSYLSPRVSSLTQLVRVELKGNRFGALPVEIKDCPQLAVSAIIAEDSLLEQLSTDVEEEQPQDEGNGDNISQ
ncbi:hypothetical protein WMY93_006371 [Mugilogobius chulae]|uniref:LRRC8 pannexin-like TM region domain-containing protein n=1 Tax=Mugilogobius chulae TaxID=88201 RepID=A0AAW0PMA6_9GOBI